MTTWAELAKAELDALGATPTAGEAREVTGKYEPVDLGAAIVEKLGETGGGGGGGLPEGWTQENDPADVFTNGGTLLVGTDGVAAVGISPGGISVKDADNLGVFNLASTGVESSPLEGATAFSAIADNGATVALDGGGLTIINLAEGTDPSDAATVSQLGAGLPTGWTQDEFNVATNGDPDLGTGGFIVGTVGGQGMTVSAGGFVGVNADSSVVFSFANGLTAADSVVILPNLPTSDPVNLGQVWNDAGTLKISAGV